MDVEKRIEAMGKELVRVRSRMEDLGPIALGTLSASRKKYRTKDGREHVCRDAAVLKFAGTKDATGARSGGPRWLRGRGGSTSPRRRSAK